MIRKSLISFLIIAAAAYAHAQTPTVSVRPSALGGDVVSITAEGLVLRTKEGEVKVEFTEETDFKRVPPENPTLKAAVASSRDEIEAGDKLLVTGILSDDKKSIPARAVYLMSKSDIARKLQKESQEWATRGISGRVASISVQTGQITVEVRGLAATSRVVITAKPEATFLRYAPDSVQFSEAVPSKLTDLAAGDMLRALGDKSADGLSFAAEQIITGAFRTIAGTVKSIDTEKEEVVITDLQSKQELTISLAKATVRKKFPPEMAMLMARSPGGGPGGQGGGRPQGLGQRPQGQANPQARPQGQGNEQQRPQAQTGQTPGGQFGGGQGRGGFGGQRGAGIDEILDRFPDISAADLKVGDMIAVSSTRTAESRINAIKLLAGIEPFIRAAQASGQGFRGGRGGRGGQDAGGDFSIPGLEGFDFP